MGSEKGGGFGYFVIDFGSRFRNVGGPDLAAIPWTMKPVQPSISMMLETSIGIVSKVEGIPLLVQMLDSCTWLGWVGGQRCHFGISRNGKIGGLGRLTSSR